MSRLTYEHVSGFFCGLAAAVNLLRPGSPRLIGEPGGGVMRVVTEDGQVVASVARALLSDVEVIQDWFRLNVVPAVLMIDPAGPAYTPPVASTVPETEQAAEQFAAELLDAEEVPPADEASERPTDLVAADESAAEGEAGGTPTEDEFDGEDSGDDLSDLL